MKVVNSEKLPIKLWLDNIEDGALEQAKNLANLPFVYKWVAIMPDSHEGYGMPIGGVIATEGVVIPNAVGVDIGCGMCAMKLDIKELSTESLKLIMGKIREKIPVGFNHHTEQQDKNLMPDYSDLTFINDGIVIKEYNSALYQIGTLGGGNHFIEIQKDEEGFYRVMIHSGSRNLGKKVADHYNKLAEELNKKWFSYQGKELAFLPLDSKEGKDYMNEMKYCVEFALSNRRLMMKRIIEAFNEVIGDIQYGELINIAHNYARMENHFGKNVLIHRKGATSARYGEIGIIPGSQGTCSYIVKGLGNEQSFMSCSHGAGRKMSRRKAQAELNLDEQIKMMDEKGIVHGIKNMQDLDEAPGAYKEIDEVMENQKDLVRILEKLTPIGVIKG